MAETFHIALAQFPASADLQQNLVRGSKMVQQAAEQGAAFIGFTELAFREFFPKHRARYDYFAWGETLDGPTVTHFSELAEKYGIDCAINFFEHAGRGRYYDATVICRPDGSVLGPVRMMHAAEEPGYNEKFYYWPGDTPPQIFDLGYAKVGVAICYDRHFPEYTRPLVLQGAELIFSPFAGLATDPLDLYVIEMQALAFQNQVYVACVNRVGKEGEMAYAGGSFVIGADSSVLAQAPRDEAFLLLAEIDLCRIDALRLQRPFLRDRRPRFYREFKI